MLQSCTDPSAGPRRASVPRSGARHRRARPIRGFPSRTATLLVRQQQMPRTARRTRQVRVRVGGPYSGTKFSGFENAGRATGGDRRPLIPYPVGDRHTKFHRQFSSRKVHNGRSLSKQLMDFPLGPICDNVLRFLSKNRSNNHYVITLYPMGAPTRRPLQPLLPLRQKTLPDSTQQWCREA